MVYRHIYKYLYTYIEVTYGYMNMNMHIFQSNTKMTVYVSNEVNINTIQLIYTSKEVASCAHAVCVLLIAISALSRSNSFSACSPTMA